MLLVLVQWIVLGVCLGGLGLLTLSGLPGVRDRRPHPVEVVFAGFAALVPLAALWNYVLPVSQGFPWVVLALALVGMWRGGIVSRATWRAGVLAWKGLSPWAQGAWVVVLLIACVKSASPSEVADDGHYFIPYIQWIEGFRLTPGIANLDDRFGFNSAAHLVTAFAGGLGPLPHGHGLNGFLLVAYAAFAIGGVDRLVKGSFQASDAVRAFGLLYLMRNLLTSVSGDVANILLGQLVFVLALRKIEARTAARPDADFHRMVLFTVLLATIKLSSLFVALVPLYFLARILHARQRPSWAVLLLVPVFIGLPWLGRFPVLSGYLVFPIQTIDVLDVDWKVPEVLVRQQYHYVGEFAKTNAKPWDSERLSARPMREWVPQWFTRENTFHKGVAVAVALLLAVGAVLLLVRGRRLLKEHGDLTVLIAILALNTMIWFARYPAFRFGWAWLVVLLGLGTYLLLVRSGTKAARIGLLAITTLFLAQNTLKTALEARSLPLRTLVAPAPLPSTPFREVPMGTFTVRVPEGQYCNSLPPPCLPPHWEGRVEARGARVEDGFRWKEGSLGVGQ